MNKRIQSLSESPCYQCHCEWECDKKIHRVSILADIRDDVFGKANFDYHECPIWIALNAPEMVEVDDE